MKFSVILPVRDDPDGLEVALRGLAEQTRRPDEIIIVNASNRPLARPDVAGLALQVVETGSALPGKARNSGARHAAHPWLVFLDAGVQPTPGWLDAFRLAAEQIPEPEVVYGCFVPRLRDDWDYAAAAVYLPPRQAPNAGSFPTTASLCIRRRFWRRIGGMNEDLRAGEDLLFFRSVADRHVVAVSAPDGLVLWELPAGPCAHYRRLRRYSRATWPTRLASQWQWPLLRMYAVALGAAFLSAVLHPVLFLPLVVLVAARILRNYGRRRRGLPGPLTWGRAIRVVTMTALVDAATLLGVWDDLRRRKSE